jgi:hypothetical protein
MTQPIFGRGVGAAASPLTTESRTEPQAAGEEATRRRKEAWLRALAWAWSPTWLQRDAASEDRAPEVSDVAARRRGERGAIGVRASVAMEGVTRSLADPPKVTGSATPSPSSPPRASVIETRYPEGASLACEGDSDATAGEALRGARSRTARDRLDRLAPGSAPEWHAPAELTEQEQAEPAEPLTVAAPAGGRPAPVLEQATGALHGALGPTTSLGAAAKGAQQPGFNPQASPAGHAGVVAKERATAALAALAVAAPTSAAAMVRDLVRPAVAEAVGASRTVAPAGAVVLLSSASAGPDLVGTGDRLAASAEAPQPPEPPRSATAKAEEPGGEPVRVHAEWTDDGVRIWLGLNRGAAALVPQLVELLVNQFRLLRSPGGARLLGLVCNGTAVWEAGPTEEAGRGDSANRSSRKSRAIRDIQRW